MRRWGYALNDCCALGDVQQTKAERQSGDGPAPVLNAECSNRTHSKGFHVSPTARLEDGSPLTEP